MVRRTTTYAIRLAVEGGGRVKAELVSVGQSGELDTLSQVISAKRIVRPAATMGLLDIAGLQRRHRARRMLRLALDPRHGAAVARRSVRLPAPMERAACAHGEWATRHAPLATATGVLTFLMG